MSRATVSNRFHMLVHRKLLKAGWDLRRAADPMPSIAGRSWFDESTDLELAMLVLLAAKGHLGIAQVGANDGRIGDPIYDFAMRYRSSTQILLVEPQESLIPFLEANYINHPAAFFANCAVGPAETLALYAVDPSCWTECAAGSPKEWPVYRGPTGVTSSDRGHVERWVRSHYRGSRAALDIVTKLDVVSLSLADVTKSVGFPPNVDVLQVDAEGADDVVIYNSSLERFKPTIVNFEHAHLDPDRTEKLSRYMAALGYQLKRGTFDTLAVLAPR